MSRAIAYRNLQAGWGILIDLVARHDVVRALPSTARPATEHVWIDVAPANRLGEDERTPSGFRVFGLGAVEQARLVDGLVIVASHLPKPGATSKSLVTIEKFGHPSVDFQDEGLTAAIVEWAAHELGFEHPHISSRLDKAQRRFIYDRPKA